MASENGVNHYSLVSSIGADKNSFFFYPKIKGALESSIKSLKFNKIHIFQPPSIIRQPELIRSGEQYSINFLQVMNKLGFLKSLKPFSDNDVFGNLKYQRYQLRADVEIPLQPGHDHPPRQIQHDQNNQLGNPRINLIGTQVIKQLPVHVKFLATNQNNQIVL